MDRENKPLSSGERATLMRELAVAVRESQNATDAFDEAAVRRLGINRTDGRCLDILDRAGRMTAGKLAEASGLSTGAVTTLLDRMERAGYVRRVRDTEDRRRVLVELTDDARRRSTEIWGPIAREAFASMESYTDAELEFIRDFMRSGTAFLERHLARIEEAG